MPVQYCLHSASEAYTFTRSKSGQSDWLCLVTWPHWERETVNLLCKGKYSCFTAWDSTEKVNQSLSILMQASERKTSQTGGQLYTYSSPYKVSKNVPTGWDKFWVSEYNAMPHWTFTWVGHMTRVCSRIEIQDTIFNESWLSCQLTSKKDYFKLDSEFKSRV